MALGRPTIYNQELADAICSRIIEGYSLRTVCKADDMPDVTTILRWLREKPDFRLQYEKAKEEQADALAEEMLDIADDGTNDWMEKYGKDGENLGYQVNGEHVQRSRLRLDTRKWIASKLKPKKYGDRIQTDSQLLDKNGQPTDPADNLLTWLASLGQTLPAEKK
jgi:hypothetical protein